MKLPYVQTSVFTDDRLNFGGNQLATFTDYELNQELDTKQMQGIALEMNFSETTFLLKTSKNECVARVRIFTPGQELAFAGHPTLGSAYVLKQCGLLDDKIEATVLDLKIGPIPVTYLDKDTIQMSQNPAEFLDIPKKIQGILDALGLDSKDLSEKASMQIVSTGFPYLIIPLRNLDTVKRTTPNPVAIIEALKGTPTQQVLVFSDETEHDESDVHARMFAPDVGVLEDPATGSAAGPLGAYLVKNQLAQKKQDIIIEQGYEISRPSQLVVRVNDLEDRILVSGKVRLTAEGQFYL